MTKNFIQFYDKKFYSILCSDFIHRNKSLTNNIESHINFTYKQSLSPNLQSSARFQTLGYEVSDLRKLRTSKAHSLTHRSRSTGALLCSLAHPAAGFGDAQPAQRLGADSATATGARPPGGAAAGGRRRFQSSANVNRPRCSGAAVLALVESAGAPSGSRSSVAASQPRGHGRFRAVALGLAASGPRDGDVGFFQIFLGPDIL